jgi:hypothetical protein
MLYKIRNVKDDKTISLKTKGNVVGGILNSLTNGVAMVITHTLDNTLLTPTAASWSCNI